MKNFKGLRVPAAIIALLLCWAFFADPIISCLAVKLEPRYLELFRRLNDFMVALTIGLVLYFPIRKQQAALRIAANEYRYLFEHIPVPMFVFDAQTYRFLAVNNAALLQYGYTRDEFMLMKVTEIRPPEYIPAFLEANLKKYPDYFDAGRWEHINKSGEKFWVHIYTHFTLFEGRHAKQALVINIDNKVKAERALEEKNAELEDVLESITDAFYTVDKDWNFTYINKEYEQLQNRKREDLLGKNVWRLFPYGKELRYYNEYERAMREQVSVHFEEYNHWNGMWIRASAYPTAKGLAIYFRDITEEKQSREKILQNEQNLRAIINNTPDLIWSVDRDFKIITANEPFWDRVAFLTGKTQENLRNSDFDQELLRPFLHNYAKAFEGTSFKVYRERTYPDGLHYEEISFNPIYDKDRQVTGVNGFIRDMTELHQHQQKVERQNTQLREIAWVQSHLTRAPLARILGLIPLIVNDEEAPSERKIMLEYMAQSASELDKVIGDICRRTVDLDEEES